MRDASRPVHPFTGDDQQGGEHHQRRQHRRDDDGDAAEREGVQKGHAHEEQREEAGAHGETGHDDDVHRAQRRDLHGIVKRLARLQLVAAPADEEQCIVDADAEPDHRHGVLREHADGHRVREREQHGERQHRGAEGDEERQRRGERRAEHGEQHDHRERYADALGTQEIFRRAGIEIVEQRHHAGDLHLEAGGEPRAAHDVPDAVDHRLGVEEALRGRSDEQQRRPAVAADHRAVAGVPGVADRPHSRRAERVLECDDGSRESWIVGSNVRRRQHDREHERRSFSERAVDVTRHELRRAVGHHVGAATEDTGEPERERRGAGEQREPQRDDEARTA